MVSNLLLSKKFHVPSVRSNFVRRDRLIVRVNQGMECKLTLISTPAGFGKTTLVSDWLWQTDLCAAWLSLDERDNDLKHFLSYFVAALQQLDAAIGQKGQAMLQSPQLPPVESLMTVLINDIAALSTKFALVLDDYHLIYSKPIHDTLTFLLNHLPPQMHLIIASRTNPPLPLSRLRARGEMVEIRGDDLRFTAEEATTFLNEVIGLNLSALDIKALEARTEGWITGLRLAALSMEERDDLAGFINCFSGSHRYVLDYLADEVLSRQSEETLDFLLQTSILNRLSGPLCNAVAQQGNSQFTLEKFEAANLFIIPLDDERCWYRYHYLFADLLRHSLQQTQPDRVSGLHLCASEWYEQNGLVTEAINHALAAQDFERAASLIEKIAEAVWDSGELATFGRWLEALPKELVRSRPQLCPFLEKKADESTQTDVYSLQPLIEPLSDRELTVLRLLAAGLSNREIAEELYLSINTVKAHTKNIYSKLNVRGRMQAVQHAKELKLL
ncbi:MAG: LuxR C-terminal-related transcriptional regulator [Xenococcaceae cyanobacterium]